MAGNGGVGYPNPNKSKNPGKNKGNSQKKNGPSYTVIPDKSSQAPKQGRNEYAYLQLPSNKQLHQETTAATNLAYHPVEQQTKANLRASEKRVKDVGNWWNEYLQTVGQSQAQTQQAYADAAAQTQGLINTGSAVDTANTSALNASQSQAAALRGQDASAANAATTGTANAALSQRNTQLGTLGAVTAGQGANQYGYLANQRRIGSGQRVAGMVGESKRGQSIRNDLRDLSKERGEYATKTLGQKAAEARELKLKKDAFHLEAKGQALSAKAEAAKAQREYKEHLEEQKLKEAGLGIDQQNANTAAKNAQTDRYEALHPGSDSTSHPTPEGLNNALSSLKRTIH